MGLISINGYEPAHLSFSTIGAYRSCGMRFYLEKIARVESRPGLAALGGNAFHTASETIDHLIWEGGLEALDAEPGEVLDNAEPPGGDSDHSNDDYGKAPF